MRPPPAQTVFWISMLSLRLLALRAEEHPDSDRLDLFHQLFNVAEDQPRTSLGHPPAARSSHPVSPSLSWAHPSSDPSPILDVPHKLPPLLLQRSRRHLLSSRGIHRHHYPEHAQLLRMGCVLGTCQVQNLSHRLYQLIGQTGREDSSPINPKSPHSYG